MSDNNPILQSILNIFLDGINDFAKKYKTESKNIALRMSTRNGIVKYYVHNGNEKPEEFNIVKYVPVHYKMLLGLKGGASNYFQEVLSGFFKRVSTEKNIEAIEINFIVRSFGNDTSGLKAFLYRGNTKVEELSLEYILNK